MGRHVWGPGIPKSTAVRAIGATEANATRKLYMSPEAIIHETLTDYQLGKSYWHVISKVDTNAAPVNKYGAMIFVTEKDGKTTLSWSTDCLPGDISAKPNEKGKDTASMATVSAVFKGSLENVKRKLNVGYC